MAERARGQKARIGNANTRSKKGGLGAQVTELIPHAIRLDGRNSNYLTVAADALVDPLMGGSDGRLLALASPSCVQLLLVRPPSFPDLAPT